MNNLTLIIGWLVVVFFASTPSQASELKITNLSNIRIYPTITSGKSKEEFGGVAIGKSATIGFSSFKLGEKVEISWEEGESYDMTFVTIDSSSLQSTQKNVNSIHLIYTGQQKWELKAFDKDHKLLGSIH